MIQDATGKFSSRSPLPDRNSLAEVIEGWSTIVGTGWIFCPHRLAPAVPPRPPYRGIRPQNQSCLSMAALRIRPQKAVQDPPFVGQRPSLLVVVLQDLVAGLGNLGPVLFEAGQDGEIALVDDRTAELLHIAGAGLLLGVRATPLLGERSRRKGGRRERIVLMASCRGKSGTGEGTSAGKCGQIGATPTRSGLPSIFIRKCKGLILRHNSGRPRFAGYLLQSCICPIRLFRQKHTETEGIRGQTLARALR